MNRAYDQGYAAYFVGDDVENNPYKMTTDDFQDWEAGFYDAMNVDCLSDEGD